MTIFGLRYRPAPYAPTSVLARLLPLVRLEFTALFRSKWGVALFCGCLVPWLVRLVMLLAWLGVLALGGPVRRGVARAPHELREFLPTNVEFYVDPVVDPGQGGLLVFLLLSAMTTARAIAKDRSTNALELYWTRGISPRGYFVAKWTGTALLVGLVTVVAPLVSWLTGVFLAEDWGFLRETWRFVPGCLLGLLLFTGVLTAICILLSALAATPNLAAVLWCLLLFGGSAAAHIVGAMFGRDVASWCSIWDAAGAVARALAGIPQRGSVVGGVVLLTGVSLALLWLARRRLRLQEAIG